VWQDLWHRWGRVFVAGDVLLVLGLIVVGIVVGYLLALPPDAGRATD